jgi:hypothetical protein
MLELVTEWKETKTDFEGFEVLTAMVVRSSACHLLHAGFLHGSLFDPVTGGDMFLQNVSRVHSIMSWNIEVFKRDFNLKNTSYNIHAK